MSLLKHMERWEDVKGYEGLYKVSNCGRVKSLGNGKSNNSKERILKQGKRKDGYLQVMLCKDGNKKTFKVHRLVAEAFIPNQENLPEVNHKDENKENNCVFNLEWCTQKYNINYGTAIKRRSKTIICVETNKVYNSAMEAERHTCISNAHIIKCCKGKRKSAGKLHWKYV